MPESRMGAMLRERREELGISLEMAATATNIRARVLGVLESGDYGNFPPYGHAMGMISSYARYLETDPRPILQEFELEWADYEAARDMAKSADRTRRGVGRFGERTSGSERPSQRAGHGALDGLRSHGADQNTGAIHAKLDDERAAEEDDRYKSGTVKVVGHRQTGAFHRVGVRHPRSGASPSDRSGARSTLNRGASLSATGRLGSSVERDSAGRARDGRTRRYSRSGRAGLDSRAGSSFSNEENARTSEQPRQKSSSHVSGAARRTSPGSREEGRYRAHSTGGAGNAHTVLGAESPAQGRFRREGGKPDFFSPEAIERRARSSSAESRTRRRKPVSQDHAVAADDNVIARVTELVTEAFSERRVRIIAIGIAALVIVVAIAAGVLISTAGNDDSGVIAVQGGAADTTKTTGDPNSASATVTTTNGNPVNVSIDVGQGQTSLVNVTYDDDNAYNGTAVGPWHREFLVTESLEATFGNPDAVTVSENGQPVNIKKDENGTGSMSLTIKTTSTSTSTGSSSESGGDKKSKKKTSKKSTSSSSSASS